MLKRLWQKEFEAVLDWLKSREKPENKVWAVGVSGGADSLALAYLAADWGKANGVKMVILTVDHQLRPESAAEAEYVARLMGQERIEHHILVWDDDKPQKGIEEAARAARYELMRRWCRDRDIDNLLIAHHKQDQAETFLMRLQRGSGVDGLAAMAPLSRWCGLNIVRPLLNVDPEDLKDYLLTRGVEWVEDQSNHCEDFLRVKVRKLLPVLEKKLGLSRERLVNTAMEMARVRDYLESQTNKFIKANVREWFGCGVCWSNETLLEQHEELGLRILSRLLKQIGGKIYPPEMEEVERLWEALKAENFRGRTLGSCEILNFQGRIWIVPELKKEIKLSREEWEKFVETQSYLDLRRVSIPYKLKLALVRKFARE